MYHSLVFHVGQEFGVQKRVLVLVSVHIHHEADRLRQNQEQYDWHPDEGLGSHEEAAVCFCQGLGGPDLSDGVC